MVKCDEMEQELIELDKQREVLIKQIAMVKRDISNFIFDSHEAAEEDIYDLLESQASEDCEGSYNCGAPSYSQDYIVDGVVYTATMTFEYNRHAKQYYYIDEERYSYKEKQ